MEELKTLREYSEIYKVPIKSMLNLVAKNNVQHVDTIINQNSNREVRRYKHSDIELVLLKTQKYRGAILENKKILTIDEYCDKYFLNRDRVAAKIKRNKLFVVEKILKGDNRGNKYFEEDIDKLFPIHEEDGKEYESERMTYSARYLPKNMEPISEWLRLSKLVEPDE